MNFRLLFAILLTSLACVATPIYDLGLPCGPTTLNCSYNYNSTYTTTSAGSGSYFYSEPGRTVENRWSNTTKNQNSYNEYAHSGEWGWLQGNSNFNSAEFNSYGFSDDYSYGCCSPDWWADSFSSGSYYSKSRSGSGISLFSDRTTITMTTFGWGDSSESWSSYYRNAGATYWPNGQSSFESIVWSNGGGSGSWNHFSQESYRDPSAVPEPTSLVMMGVGLIAVGALRFRRRSRVS